MPYYHLKDNGEVKFWSRKCKVCGKHWSFMTLFAMSPPKDMRYFIHTPQLKVKKGKTSYAKWAEKVPGGAATVASWLPNWPRWARIAFVLGLAVVLSIVFYFIFSR